MGLSVCVCVCVCGGGGGGGLVHRGGLVHTTTVILTHLHHFYNELNINSYLRDIIKSLFLKYGKKYVQYFFVCLLSRTPGLWLWLKVEINAFTRWGEGGGGGAYTRSNYVLAEK